MLSFLRALRTPPSPRVAGLEWDGRVLSLGPAITGGATRVAIELDGRFFSEASPDDQGRIRFEFPFAPALDEHRLDLRDGRDGALLVPSHSIRFGAPDFGPAPAPAASPRWPAPLPDAVSRPLANGVDLRDVEVAIVVPVYDAPDAVRACIDSVLRHTRGRARLIVIDDASPDPAIAPLLARYAGRCGVEVLRNEKNRGFTATANRGIDAAGRADVVLLNADTEVGPCWLDGLRRAACSGTDVATATAVSDNAGAFSVPELEQENAMPAGWSIEDCARAHWQHAGIAYPELPSGNGFCMYLKRAVVDAIGRLDEDAFPAGYGEENDFCQRASARGFRHLIAGNVFVHHARSRSFGHERRLALGVTGMAILRERWPRYEADVAATLWSYPRRVLDWRVRMIHAAAPCGRPRPRVLVAGASTRAAGSVESWRLCRDRRRLYLVDANDTIAADRRGDGAARAAMLTRWLETFAFEAVLVDSADAELRALIEPRTSALAIPCACIDRACIDAGDDADAALARAIEAASSFAECAT